MFQSSVILVFSYQTQKATDFSWLGGGQIVDGSHADGKKRQSRKNSCI